MGVKIAHASAKASHYDEEAKFYDVYNEKNSALINRTIEKIMQRYKLKSVLDLSCGTGSQVFWLAKRAYELVGVDINSQMLKVAKNKAKKEKLSLKFIKGDMRTSQLGKFDVVITIFNSIGHLSKVDFAKALQNINRNLKPNGLYIFDIFNLNFLLYADNISHLTIDWQREVGKTKIRDIQYSTIDEKGVLTSYTFSYMQKKSGQQKSSKNVQTLQVYTVKQLKELLQKNGFKLLKQFGIDGAKFNDKKTERMLLVAQKTL